MSVEWIVSSSGLILLVLLVRLLFKKKISPCLRYALWLVVALRLLLPISISGTAVSILNLLPQQDMVWEGNKTGQIIYEQSSESGSVKSESVKAPEMSEDLIIEKKAEIQSIATGNIEAENEEVENAKAEKEEAGNAEAAKDSLEIEKRLFTNVKEIFTNGNMMDVGMALRLCHLLGAGICGCVFLAVNLDYGRKLRRSRKKIELENLPVMSVIPVYESQIIQTPCLFGLLGPAIYVMEDTVREEQTFRFVLCHENTHYRHHDHWWALVRILCLCVHWFNPLVWLAAGLSRQDGELACDEKALKMLGDKVRVDYGKALLELSAEKVSYINGWRISTTMSGSARQMKERLWMIVNAPGRRVWRQALVMILVLCLSVITFTGKSRAQERENLYAESEDGAGVDTEKNVDAENPGSASTTNLTENSESEEVFSKDDQTEGEKQEEKYTEEDETQEVEFYREIVPVMIGEKEYELWCDGHTAEYGFYTVDTISLVDPEKPDQYVDTISTKEISRAYWNTPEGQETFDVQSRSRDGGILIVDLNFDGWNDFCFEEQCTSANIPYNCMLWNPVTSRYEYNGAICNVEVDEEQQWISEHTRDSASQYSTTYYRYDEYSQLHMVRYVEEDLSSDAMFEQLDLTYVEDEESIYVLPAIVDERELHYTMIAMAKQSLTELYMWTGEKVDTACFQVTNMGSVYFGLTPEDIRHSRTFFDRSFGADTAYNLSEYDKSISSMYITSGRSVWYSPVLWRIFPDRADEMTEEEVITWYLERVPLVKDCKVKSIEKRFEDMWTIQTESGVWFEVAYDVKLKEIGMVFGPYPEYPVH